MKVIKARKILKALKDDGWILKHQVEATPSLFTPLNREK
jgi:hypothetical protein